MTQVAQPKGRPRSTSSEEEVRGDPSLLLVLKWGGELTPTGRVQAEELGKVFRCMYPGGQGKCAECCAPPVCSSLLQRLAHGGCQTSLKPFGPFQIC